jgi:hypothetical protein
VAEQGGKRPMPLTILIERIIGRSCRKSAKAPRKSVPGVVDGLAS